MKKVLVIVAHPDDEIIWMGGTLIRNKNNWDTTVISLCRIEDKDRNPKFFRACEILGVNGFMSDLDDEIMNDVDVLEVIKRIKKFAEAEYDFIFTHGVNGEYGHKRHIGVNRAVVEMLNMKLLKAKKVLFFSYEKRENKHQGYAIYNSSADKLIKLNDDELATKKKIIQEIYGYKEGGFEELSCGEIESFNELKNENSCALSISC